MAVRTTEADVKAILLRDYDDIESPSLVPFITTASMVVDRLATQATANGVAFSITQQELVERWLSAHYYAQSDKPFQEESTGMAKSVYSGVTGKYLDSTLYGQTAKSIDPTGLLAGLTSGKTYGAFWLGKSPDNEVDYDQRTEG